MFTNRLKAGEELALRLQSYTKQNAVILAIPRGGVVVGKAIASALQLPFDIVVIKKVSDPHNPELALGAVGPKDSIYWDKKITKTTGLHRHDLTALRQKSEKEREEREQQLHSERQTLSLEDKVVVLVDDGTATGATAMCAWQYVHNQHASKIVLAVPVIATETLEKLLHVFDAVIAINVAKDFRSVGYFYKDFREVSDEEVKKIL